MFPLIIAVLTASVLGSTHCVGMCGAFVAFAVAGNDLANPGAPRPLASRALLNAAYNLGRLVTYLTLGSIAGAIGSAIDLGGGMLGVQRAAAIAAGAIMVGFGIVAVLRHMGVHVPRMPLPKRMTELAKVAHAKAFELSPLARAGMVGLLTTLLPCGWLYAFVITAAGTAHPLYGAITMLAFWLGTLPVLAALGLGIQSLTGRLRRHLPLVTSLALVAVGIWTLMGRLTAPALAARPVVATSMEDAARTVEATADHAQKTCPLCHPSLK